MENAATINTTVTSGGAITSTITNTASIQSTVTGGATGATGPTGATGATGATGPNTVSTATTTALSGILKGNGANITTATAGTDYQSPLTLPLSIANGGTGSTTQQSALNALAGTQVTAKYLRSDGTNTTLSSIVAADVPTLNQNTTGSANSFTGSLIGDVSGTQSTTSVDKVKGVTMTAAAATLASQLNGATTRSATATLTAGEETVFTGSTAAQTLTLPVTPQVSSINLLTNLASVNVSLVAGAGNTINNNGGSGSLTLVPGQSVTLVFIGTVWYVTNLVQLGVTGTGSTVLATSPTLTTPVISSIVNTGTLTLPTSTDTLVARATTDTLTNKRLTKRVSTLTVSTSTYTPNGDTTDVALISSPSANFTVANPTGTPNDGDSLLVRIKSGTTGFTPTWGAAYKSSGIAALPTTALPASKTVTLGFKYDLAAALWILLALDGTGY